jgi:triacylglycerol esterase/lipase EstA (alpha/beta hydrolase family)
MFRALLVPFVIAVAAACGDIGIGLDPTADPDAPTPVETDKPDASIPILPFPIDPPPKPEPAPRLGPPYPIVLVHGFFVSDEIGPVDYWWRIPERLRREGEQVFVSSEEPLRTPQERAVQLAGQVDRVLAETRAEKVNLIAHSMGGLDARVLISALGYGDRIASLTTIGTPHRGTPVADAILGIIPNGVEVDVGELVNGFAQFVDGDRQNALEAARVMSTEGAARFNAEHPDDARVTYLSVVGRTTADPFFVFNEHDYVDAGLWGSFAYLRLLGLRSDGLVPTDSQKWGEHVATVQADHYNEIGQILGVVGFAFDPWDFYADHAKALHARGF